MKKAIYVVSILALLIVPPLDGVRDAVIQRVGMSWWPWHIVKWLAFFLPLGVCLGVVIEQAYSTAWKVTLALLAIIWGFVSWNVAYNYFNHVRILFL